MRITQLLAATTLVAGLVTGATASAVATTTGPTGQAPDTATPAGAGPSGAGPSGSRAAEPPSGDELSEAVKECPEQLSNGKYAERSGGARTVPVCATGNAVHWRSGMTIDCDGQRTDNCNSNTDPYFQNGTAWPQSDGKPLIADQLPYVVVPGESSIWHYADADITGGTVVAVVYQGKVVYAVVGDSGPADAIGEGSYALAEALGINPDPSTGGVSGKVVDYIAFPRVEASPIENHDDAVRKGEQAAADLVAGRQGCLGMRLGYASYDQLNSGDSGDQVRAAQCLLRANGYETGAGEPSGTLDESTVSAVEQFQQDVGLEATGTIDSHTWTALHSAGSTPSLQDGSRGEAVERVQRALNAAVDTRLSVDGIYGGKTSSGVERYQSAKGLGVDGVVGANTWSALQSGK